MLRKGFTLVEMLVALFVGALVVDGARRLTEALADTRSIIRREAVMLDERANAQMATRSVVRQLSHGVSAEDEVEAKNGSVTFSSSCEAARGWSERCRVTLVLVPASHDQRLMVHLDGGTAFDSRFDGVTGPILYLSSAREWTMQPGDRVAALGIVRARDTLLLPVGSR